MKFAIIAAGEGLRLRQEGVKESKPLVCINGEPLIDRLIRIFRKQDASEIVVIINDHMPDVAEHLYHLQQVHTTENLCPLTVLRKNTPSSMHSFYETSRYLETEPFCLTTVDTVFQEEDFRKYIAAFLSYTGAALMAVTDFIDDEKPLYVATASDMTITGFYDAPNGCNYISGGIYCLKPSAMPALYSCISEGQSHMRNFQRRLIADGLKVHAYCFPKILDIDHLDDIIKAQDFLQVK